MKLTLEKLSEITSYKVNTLRLYLQGYRFTRFEVYQNRKVHYEFNQDFVNEFVKYIWIKRREDVSQKLQKKLLYMVEQEE